jgi:hypothetical protein
MMRTTLRTLVLLIAPLAVPGCGASDGTIQVTGKRFKGGAKYSPPEGQTIDLTFFAMEQTDASAKSLPSKESYAAQYDADEGAFTVPGHEGRGIPPGKYRVSVIQKARSDARPESKKRNEAFDRETDFLKDRFGPVTSPIIRELKSSTDLENPLGS